MQLEKLFLIYNSVEENTIIKDKLASQRTHLANERTLLAYIRTFLAMLGLGVLLIKYQPTIYSFIAGVCSITVSLVLLVVGIFRYFKNKKNI
jgi:putative membrane protein